MSNTTELSDAIAALRQEIAELEDADGDTRDQLIGLADLMENRLHGQQIANEPHPPTMDSVMELIETYEARHPRVIAMANDLMTRLAAMGI